jgi:hypothetical protein
VDSTVCGNLTFNGRTRTFDATYVVGPGEPPYLYWWRGSRDQNNGTYDLDTLMVDTITSATDTLHYVDAASLPLEDDFDAIGVVLMLSLDSALTPTDSAFLGTTITDRNYMLQHWREKLPPQPDSARVAGTVVTLWWTNRHGSRPIDSTVVFRDGAPRRTLDYLAESFVDTVPGWDTYGYRLKHVAGPVVNDYNLVSPNSPSSDSLVVTVAPPPPPLSVAINGPDYLYEPGIYSWSATVTGGTAPYTYQWWLDPFRGGQDWQLVGTSSGYARKVTYLDMGFNLRVDVTDAAQEVGSALKAVSTDWGYGPLTGGQR